MKKKYSLSIKKTGTQLVINMDAHAPGDLIDQNLAKQAVCGARLTYHPKLCSSSRAWRRTAPLYPDPVREYQACGYQQCFQDLVR